MRIGFGFDTHQLTADRPLILGGVNIPSALGCLGHSDADVLVHAIIDALFGAANMHDIGYHFPDTDIKYKNANSLYLLQCCRDLVYEKYTINNIDCTLVLEKPKLLPYMEQMKSNIAEILQISTNDISIKAKTSEKMGFIGRQEGISAYAVVLLSTKI
ncbi:MAG: 2-C-methyl-D-erythritol 2,4-cyclodiphosphate synthase [Bacteroidales bacterium]|nr:2-C-methyl-D-erythritol 2,4-cyclodiphosphate synthase [Bacteroidales bacterium]